MKPFVIVYSSATCPYCDRAKLLLKKKKVEFTEIRVDLDPDQRVEMINKSQRQSVPQIFIGDYHVGGCDDLYALDAAGRLDPLLESS